MNQIDIFIHKKLRNEKVFIQISNITSYLFLLLLHWAPVFDCCRNAVTWRTTNGYLTVTLTFCKKLHRSSAEKLITFVNLKKFMVRNSDFGIFEGLLENVWKMEAIFPKTALKIAIWVFLSVLKSKSGYFLGFSKKISDKHTNHFYIKSPPGK